MPANWRSCVFMGSFLWNCSYCVTLMVRSSLVSARRAAHHELHLVVFDRPCLGGRIPVRSRLPGRVIVTVLVSPARDAHPLEARSSLFGRFHRGPDVLDIQLHHFVPARVPVFFTSTFTSTKALALNAARADPQGSNRQRSSNSARIPNG